MTKKHFIALAEALVQHNRNVELDKVIEPLVRSHRSAILPNLFEDTGAPRPFLLTHLQMLANFCASQNPQFNRERWLGYIAGTNGANGGTVKPPSKPRVITPERKLARRLEGKTVPGYGE